MRKQIVRVAAIILTSVVAYVILAFVLKALAYLMILISETYNVPL